MNKSFRTKYIQILFLFLATFTAYGQSVIQGAGPIIEDVGSVFYGYSPQHPVDTTLEYRVVFDLHAADQKPDQVNLLLNSIARFINLHTRYGVPLDHLHVAGVFHGSAGKDALSDAAYTQRFGVANPNTHLIEALKDAGVELFLCGQTAYARGLEPSNLNPGVKLALSAMTILTEYQQKGYAVIRF